MTPGSFDALTVVMLGNASCFQSSWESRFAKSKTKKATFQNIEWKEVNMMYQHKTLYYHDNLAEREEGKVPGEIFVQARRNVHDYFAPA